MTQSIPPSFIAPTPPHHHPSTPPSRKIQPLEDNTKQKGRSSERTAAAQGAPAPPFRFSKVMSGRTGPKLEAGGGKGVCDDDSPEPVVATLEGALRDISACGAFKQYLDSILATENVLVNHSCRVFFPLDPDTPFPPSTFFLPFSSCSFGWRLSVSA
jgi:hypothetical protein